MANGHNAFNPSACQLRASKPGLQSEFLKSTTLFACPDKMELYNGEKIVDEERG